MRYTDLISTKEIIESLSSSYSFTKKTELNNYVYYSFTNKNDNKINVYFEKDTSSSKNIWSMSFESSNEIEYLTNEFDSFKTFSTIISICKNFIQSEYPDIIYFISFDKDQNNKPINRSKLYKRLLDSQLKGLNYHYNMREISSSSTKFIIKKNNY